MQISRTNSVHYINNFKPQNLDDQLKSALCDLDVEKAKQLILDGANPNLIMELSKEALKPAYKVLFKHILSLHFQEKLGLRDEVMCIQGAELCVEMFGKELAVNETLLEEAQNYLNSGDIKRWKQIWYPWIKDHFEILFNMAFSSICDHDMDTIKVEPLAFAVLLGDADLLRVLLLAGADHYKILDYNSEFCQEILSPEMALMILSSGKDIVDFDYKVNNLN